MLSVDGPGAVRVSDVTGGQAHRLLIGLLESGQADLEHLAAWINRSLEES